MNVGKRIRYSQGEKPADWRAQGVNVRKGICYSQGEKPADWRAQGMSGRIGKGES